MSPTDAQFPLLPPPDEAARLRDHIIAVIRDLLDSAPRQPGPSELLDKIQAQLGWPARHEFLASVRSMREDHALQSYQRDYLNTVLGDDAINDALRDQARWTHEDHATLDDLFRRSKAPRDSNAFREMLNFTARFRDYAPFNNLLVRLQYPSCSYFATARDWKDRFNRAIKEDARPLLILAPMHPVMCVYDLESTEGPPPAG